MTRYGVRMRGKDAVHLAEDALGQPKHTVKVLHLDPSTRLDEAALHAHVRERVAGLPLLRRVARGAGMSGSWWEELPSVDVGPHLDRAVIAPGRVALESAIAERLATRLPRGRPLWQISLLDAADRQTLVLAASHALLDGHVAAAVLSALFGPNPTAWPLQSRRLRPAPVEAGILAARVPQLVVRGLRSAVRKRSAGGSGTAPRPFTGAAGAWNAYRTDTARSYSQAGFELGEFMATARRAEVTFTELAVALAGAAVRAYLAEAAAMPERDMLAVVPVGVRTGDDGPAEANLVTFVFVHMGVLAAEPRERLGLVAQSSRAAKARLAAGDRRLFVDAWDYWPLVQLVRRVGRRVSDGPPASVTVSTVRGPREPLAVAGVPVTEVVSGGVVLDDSGLNMTVWSAADRVTFGVTGRPSLVDVAKLADGVAVAFAELRDET